MRTNYKILKLLK